MIDEWGVELGTCDLNSAPHPKAFCMDWQTPHAPRVEIWRFNDTTLTVARTDGACWNGPDALFTNVKHEGYWNSQLMRFERDEYYFSDGTPIELYDGMSNEC